MGITPVHVRAFLPLVMPWLPGAPLPLVERAIRNSAIAFCERTRCWRHICTVTLTAQDEAVVAPDYAAIFEFERATFNGEPLAPTQFSDVADETAEEGVPRYITQKSPDTITVIPFEEGEVSLSVFLKPRGDSDYSRTDAAPLEDYYDRVPDFLLSQHGEPVAWGAIARLHAIPGETFSDPQRALLFAGMFDDACDRHFSNSTRGQQRASARTKLRFV